jgi:diadenosine tetraphosphate (Ap4A) HIT family hydrolase
MNERGEIMKAEWDKDCISCRSIQGIERLSPVPRILETRHWVAEHLSSTSIKGWVIVLPKRHVTAIHQLPKEDMVEFGELLHVICEGQYALYKPVKEYFMQYSEGEGYSHTHVHIVPRVPELPDKFKGPRVMRAMGNNPENTLPILPIEEVTAEALKLRKYLLEHLPAKLIIK